jgi:TPR repeat protein
LTWQHWIPKSKTNKTRRIHVPFFLILLKIFLLKPIFFSPKKKKKRGMSDATWEEIEFQTLKRAARMGDAESRYQLARYYEDGNGTSKDLDTARKWYLCAEAQGHAESQFRLGLRDFLAANPNCITWLSKAANQGHLEAQHLLVINRCRLAKSSEEYKDDIAALRKGHRNKWSKAQAADYEFLVSTFETGHKEAAVLEAAVLDCANPKKHKKRKRRDEEQRH